MLGATLDSFLLGWRTGSVLSLNRSGVTRWPTLVAYSSRRFGTHAVVGWADSTCGWGCKFDVHIACGLVPVALGDVRFTVRDA